MEADDLLWRPLKEAETEALLEFVVNHHIQQISTGMTSDLNNLQTHGKRLSIILQQSNQNGGKRVMIKNMVDKQEKMTHFLVYKCSEMLSINIYVTFLKGNTKHEAFTLTKIQFSIFFKAVLLLRRSIVVLHSPAVSSSKRSLRTLIYSTALPFAPVIKFLIIGITNLPPFHTNTHSFIRFTVSVAST